MSNACREEGLKISLALAWGSNIGVRVGIRGAEEDHTPSTLDLHAILCQHHACNWSQTQQPERAL